MGRRRKERKFRSGTKPFQTVCSRCQHPIAMRHDGLGWRPFELGAISPHTCQAATRWEDPKSGPFGNRRR